MVTVNSHRRKRRTSLRTTHKTTKCHWICTNVHRYWFLEHLFTKTHPKPHLPKMHFRKMQSQPSTHNAKRMNFHSKLIRTTQKCTKNSAISAFECATDWASFPVRLGHQNSFVQKRACTAQTQTAYARTGLNFKVIRMFALGITTDFSGRMLFWIICRRILSIFGGKWGGWN